ncbi:type II CRISPR RNA-guided endonuclease Cas9 [Flavobacterium sp. 102]|uniref:type II CRISPR RNA-guided endonuclease Cas9 n=1 Tax=Flavobacterium sp. 102 TaxID=2135623 RepID=UPI000EB2193E|nr:type II CRISPR RNA-guided endonuclease Cas9 [Flavobacterium sp. 102]RKS02928.1 CRISPR-associated endonuclease Csn1 [Flavobacterium sp. 102]
MAKILGLDLGTNSIGWAIVDKDGSEFALVDKGVRIFSEGVNIEAKTNSESSKAAKRTEYRSARKLKYRRKIRKIDILKVLSDNDLCPKLSDDDLNKWRYKKIYPQNDEFRVWLSTDSHENENERKKQNENPYFFRYRSANESLNLNNKKDRFVLGRAFYHIAQRRGFLSNRLDSSDNSIIEEKKDEITSLINDAVTIFDFSEMFSDFLLNFDKDEASDKPLFALSRAFNTIIKEQAVLNYNDLKEKLIERLNRKEFLGPVKRAISDLSEKIVKSNCSTLGQYFYTLHQTGQKIRGEYTHREDHYLAEFNFISDKQSLDTELREKIKEAIFFQRPLKSQKGLVAKCPLENRKACVPISHPDFEEFRMLSYLNNVKIKLPIDEKLRLLNDDERQQIQSLFFRKSKANFDFVDIAKKLTPKNLKSGYYRDKNVTEYDVLFNYNFGSNVAGCPTIANLIEVFGLDWKTYLYSNFVKNTKIENNVRVKKTVEDIVDDVWHVLFRFDKEERLKQFAIDNFNCDDKIATKFSKIKLKLDYGSLSLKAIRNILPYLRMNLIYSHAVFLANMKNVLPKEIWDNEENKAIINNEINSIIENYKAYSNRIDVVNGLIKNVKKDNGTWSSDNQFVAEAYRNSLNKQIKDFFGAKKWNETSETYQNEILSECFELFVNQMKLNSGRGEFAKKKTIDEILKVFLSDNFDVNDDDLKRLYHPSAIEVYKKAKRGEDDGKLYLGSPIISSIKNPMAMRSLHQLKKVVNQLMKDDLIDEDTIIHVEMPRELNSANERVAIRQWQEDLKNRRSKYGAEIKSIFNGEIKNDSCNDSNTGYSDYEPTETDILKYQLWIEQNKVCLYTGKTICLSDFIGNNPKYDIEHTIPRSRSLDNSQVNKTLCCAIYNRQIKKDKIPFECENYDEILPRIKHWYARYKTLEEQIKELSKKVKAASIKEKRDKYIIDRTKLRFEHTYYYKKYKSFTMEEVPEGFKNSQSVDIGIISKYGNLFLKTVFSKVYPIKGKTTANLRQMWGLEEKTRDNHAHHAKDAVVVACCTRDINDALANYYHDLEQFEFFGKPKPSFAHRIPWDGFHKDVADFDKNTLISHHTPDVLPIQSKKAIRKRGIIQRNEKGEIKYKQGDTVRGALHKESFYGAILREEISKKTGKPEEVVKYVKRQAIELFKDADLKNIVDDKIKEIVINGREQEKQLKKEIDDLKKQMRDLKEEDEQPLRDSIQLLENKIKNGLYVLPNGSGAPVPIKKIRYYTSDVTNPLFIKKHRDVSRHEHKQFYHVKNDGNYCFALYSGKDDKGKIISEYKVVNNFEAGKYYNSKENTHKYPLEFNLQDKNKNILDLKFLLKTGTLVLFYKDFEDEIWELENFDLVKRLYKTVAIESDGRVQFRLHSTSKPDGLLEKSSEINFDIANEKLRLSKSALKILVEGFNFKISVSGKIQKV